MLLALCCQHCMFSKACALSGFMMPGRQHKVWLHLHLQRAAVLPSRRWCKAQFNWGARESACKKHGQQRGLGKRSLATTHACCLPHDTSNSSVVARKTLPCSLLLSKQ